MNSGVFAQRLFWLWKGRDGLAEVRAVIEGTTLAPADPFAVLSTFWQLVYEGDPRAAIASLSATDDDWIRIGFSVDPRSLLAAQALELASDAEAAHSAYEAAVDELLAEIERRPDDVRLPGPLGIAYAALGRREEAIAAARRGVEMMPHSKDAYLGPYRLVELAQVYTRLGELDAALEQLDAVLDLSSEFSVALLELDPRWDPLREHPRYREIVEKYNSLGS